MNSSNCLLLLDFDWTNLRQRTEKVVTITQVRFIYSYIFLIFCSKGYMNFFSTRVGKRVTDAFGTNPSKTCSVFLKVKIFSMFSFTPGLSFLGLVLLGRERKRALNESIRGLIASMWISHQHLGFKSFPPLCV